MTLAVVDPDAIRRAPLVHDPYDYVITDHALAEAATVDLARDFPAIDKPGYVTVEHDRLTGRFRQLVEELEGDEFSGLMSEKFGIDLRPYPRLTTIMRRSQPKYGAIHTDGPAKVMTLLIYLNTDWSGEGGRLRALYDGTHYEPYAAEIPPLMGWMFAFLRSDHSWHGHRPFVGERRVVQVAWLKDAGELERKVKRNAFAQRLKGLFGR